MHIFILRLRHDVGFGGLTVVVGGGIGFGGLGACGLVAVGEVAHQLLVLASNYLQNRRTPICKKRIEKEIRKCRTPA